MTAPARRAPRVIAIDWSGARTGARKKIWLAEIVDGRVSRLESGRGREEIAALLMDEAARDPHMVVGMDFAFSMPAWFVRERGFASAHTLWAHVAAGAAEDWLRNCDAPFWGRPHRRRGAADAARPQMRRCDTDGAKSVFQVGGAGAVGTGSLRGMPMLHRLRDAGFHIWPFDDAAFPLLIEIYPRILTGAVRKSSQAARAEYIDRWLQSATHGIEMPHEFLDRVRASEDAFDALFSAIRMWEHREEFGALPSPADEVERIEGAIWRPHAIGRS